MIGSVFKEGDRRPLTDDEIKDFERQKGGVGWLKPERNQAKRSGVRDPNKKVAPRIIGQDENEPDWVRALLNEANVGSQPVVSDVAKSASSTQFVVEPELPDWLKEKPSTGWGPEVPGSGVQRIEKEKFGVFPTMVMGLMRLFRWIGF